VSQSPAPRPLRKRADRYHHGDLRRALLLEAVRIIQSQGVERLTLREVGGKLGVSRTALYRHFTDKSALLNAVAREGFRMLRLRLVDAWERGGRGEKGFDWMGRAYVRFAVENPAHYRVMFGGFVRGGTSDKELSAEASAAFQALVDALVALQNEGLVRRDEPVQLARFIWANVHGVAMLAIDGHLRGKHGDPDELMRYANERLRTGIATERDFRT
jgi:AcrR family transcriptional regulator